MQTSAKDNVGVTEGFRKIVEDAVQNNLINMAFNNDKKEVKDANHLKVENSLPAKKTCC